MVRVTGIVTGKDRVNACGSRVTGIVTGKDRVNACGSLIVSVVGTKMAPRPLQSGVVSLDYLLAGVG